jgi:hypothetical protein
MCRNLNRIVRVIKDAIRCGKRAEAAPPPAAANRGKSSRSGGSCWRRGSRTSSSSSVTVRRRSLPCAEPRMECAGRYETDPAVHGEQPWGMVHTTAAGPRSVALSEGGPRSPGRRAAAAGVGQWAEGWPAGDHVPACPAGQGPRFASPRLTSLLSRMRTPSARHTRPGPLTGPRLALQVLKGPTDRAYLALAGHNTEQAYL